MIRGVFPELCETENFQTAKATFKVTKGHRQWCHSIGHICRGVLIEHRLVTDIQTERQTHDDGKYRASIASRG